MTALDRLSTVSSELVADDLDVTGGMLPIPWICLWFPEFCWPYLF